jgi:hypothetical protein
MEQKDSQKNNSLELNLKLQSMGKQAFIKIPSAKMTLKIDSTVARMLHLVLFLSHYQQFTTQRSISTFFQVWTPFWTPLKERFQIEPIILDILLLRNDLKLNIIVRSKQNAHCKMISKKRLRT